MAVLCDRTTFSVKGNCWKGVGSRTFLTSALIRQYCLRLAEIHPKTLTVVEELVAGQSSSNGNGNRHQGLVDQGSSNDQDCRRSVDALDVLGSEGPCGLVGVLGRHDECWMSREEGERD